MRKQKLVMIGNGMAGVRTIEELLKLDSELYDITIFGAEPHPNYNRILLSPVLAGEQTLEQIVLNDLDWYKSNGVNLHLGKTVTVSEDFPAFIVNRILLPMINEAIYTLYEGVGSVEAIDTAMRLGANHPMGPLQLADFIGLDTCLSVMQVLHEGLADSKYRPCPLLVKYVEAGWLGRKTKRGFYDYRGETPVPTR